MTQLGDNLIKALEDSKNSGLVSLTTAKSSCDILRTFNDFTNGVRVMMLIDRSVGNTNKGSKRWINKLVSVDSKQFADNLHKLLELQNYIGNTDIRLYSCVNSRKLHRAINHFRHQQLDVPEKDAEQFYSRLNDKFCSSLMQPENRAENLFLIDLDEKNTFPLETKLTELQLKIHLKYETPNGWHFVVDPFNPALLNGVVDCEIKKDALLLLNYL